jgi:hypothetical protein
VCASEIRAAFAEAVSLLEPAGAVPRGGAAENEGDRPVSWETSCLSLCWAVLDIVIAGARGLGLSDPEYREVVQLKTARAYPDKAASKVASDERTAGATPPLLQQSRNAIPPVFAAMLGQTSRIAGCQCSRSLAGITSSQDASCPTDRIAIASVLMAGLLVGAVLATRFGFFSPGAGSTPGALGVGAAGQPTRVQVGYQPTTAPSGSNAAPAVSAQSTATATSEAEERMRIVNTGGQGVVLRDSPLEDDQTPRGFMDGTWVTMLEQHGPDWARVRGDNGQEGWVPSRYLGR